jgi:two-component system chemotaxis response regulator CheB
MGMTRKPSLIVIGTSTGGLDALKQILSRLPATFPAAVLVVMHVGPYKSTLPKLLQLQSTLSVRHAIDGESINASEVLIAPPDRHLFVEGNIVRLSAGPKENFSRPAIDPLFRSAAIAHRERVIGVVLTGNLDDGTVGLQAIKTYGGAAIVQDPAEAVASSMPRSAVEHVRIDFCLPLAGIAEKLVELTSRQMSPVEGSPTAGMARTENSYATEDIPGIEELQQIGKTSEFSCPECSGALWEIGTARPMRFRCHTGHAYTATTLAAGQSRCIEEAIWSAVRALHERESLFKRTAKIAAETDRLGAAAEHLSSAEQAAHHAKVLREMLLQREPVK